MIAAVSRACASLIVAAKLSQLFQHIGGRGARSWTSRVVAVREKAGGSELAATSPAIVPRRVQPGISEPRFRSFAPRSEARRVGNKWCKTCRPRRTRVEEK